MPKATKDQLSFATGEISPLVYGRVDSDRYNQALQKCFNFIPTIQGPILRRPGTKFAGNAKSSAQPPILIPFKLTESNAYILEFGNQYIRFWNSDGQVIAGTTVFKVSGTIQNQPFSPFYGLEPTPYGGLNQQINASSVLASGSVLELQSPYTYATAGSSQLKYLMYAQHNNVLYLAHQNYPPYQLQNFGPNTWQLSQLLTEDGPYLPLNSYQVEGDLANVIFQGLSAPTISNITTPAYFFQTGSSVQITSLSPAGANTLVTTQGPHGFQTGQKVFIAGVNGTTSVNNQNPNGLPNPTSGSSLFWTVTVTLNNALLLNGAPWNGAMVGSSGRMFPALFMPTPDNSNWEDLGRIMAFYQYGQRYWGYVNTISNVCQGIVYMTNQQNALVDTSNIAVWQMGVWSSTFGYPQAVCFHQDRLCFGGNRLAPQRFDASFISDYANFATSVAQSSATASALQVNDNNAISFNLASNDLNRILWMKSSSEGLVAGTQAAEWSITPSSQATALTPTNFNARQSSFFGVGNVDAVQACNATLYIDKAYRKIRELNYFFQVNAFRSTDMSELSDHITIPSITKLAVQKDTVPVVWAMRSDGNLVSMSYNRDDTTLKAGWASHQLGGFSDQAFSTPQVVSIASIPCSSALYDELWIAVQRELVNGSSFCSIEYMGRPYDDAIAQPDAFQVDCGATYDNPIPITGMALFGGPLGVTIPALVQTVGSSLVLGTINNGSSVMITDVVGANRQDYDINGNYLGLSNLLNGKTFLVASSILSNTSFNTMTLLDMSGNTISGSSYSGINIEGNLRVMVNSISGFTWIPGETVGVWADGKWHPDVVISNSSSIQLQYPVAKAQIGYRYNSDGMTLRSNVGSADGSAVGKLRRISHAMIMLHDVCDFNLGRTFTNMFPATFMSADTQSSDIAATLFNGIDREFFEGVYEVDDYVAFRMSSPGPGMVQSITTVLEEFDL